jgi:FkbM family methyltransferase
MNLSPESVTWVYRILLGREPESAEVVRRVVDSKISLEGYVNIALNCEEFRSTHQFLPRPNIWVWAECKNFLLRVNLADRFVSWNVINNSFEQAESTLVKSVLKSGDIALDVGANLGYYTMLFVSLVGDKGHVYSFEPMPKLFDSLKQSTKRNGFDDRVAAFNAALSDEIGQVPLIFAPGSDNWGGAALWAGREVLPHHTTIAVTTGPLSFFSKLDRIEFVKIDVQGAEPLVIRGCSDVLAASKPLILSEVHPAMLRTVSDQSVEGYFRQLESIGYEAHSLTRDGHIGPLIAPGSIDVLAKVVFLPRGQERRFASIIDRSSQGGMA